MSKPSDETIRYWLRNAGFLPEETEMSQSKAIDELATIDEPLCDGAIKFTNIADVIYHLCPVCGAPWIKAGEPHVRPCAQSEESK